MNLQKQRELRIRNMITLTLQSQSLGKQGWTLDEFTNLSKCSKCTARLFINKCIVLGYVIKSGQNYVWIKKVPENINSLNRTISYIANNFKQNVYKSISLSYFSSEALVDELIKRNILQ